MEELLNACKTIFDGSPQAVGVAHVLVDDDGVPYDFSYEYLNDAMAAFSGDRTEDLLGSAVTSTGATTAWAGWPI